MDDWKKFNGTSLPEKKDFYNHLNRIEITDTDYSHAWPTQYTPIFLTFHWPILRGLMIFFLIGSKPNEILKLK